MWNKAFWKDVAERTIKTSAQVGAGLLTAAGIGPYVGAHVEIDWRGWTATVLASVAWAFLSCLASAPVGRRGTASVMRQ